jgi:hypothetical protein
LIRLTSKSQTRSQSTFHSCSSPCITAGQAHALHTDPFVTSSVAGKQSQRHSDADLPPDGLLRPLLLDRRRPRCHPAAARPRLLTIVNWLCGVSGRLAARRRPHVDQIAAEANATADQPLPPGATFTRPNSSVTVATRVSPEDLAEIEHLAARPGCAAVRPRAWMDSCRPQRTRLRPCRARASGSRPTCSACANSSLDPRRPARRMHSAVRAQTSGADHHDEARAVPPTTTSCSRSFGRT